MVDLQGQYQQIKETVNTSIEQVLNSSTYINGPLVHEFQSDLEKYLGVKHVIPCANGTDALQIAMMGLGLEQGDEVITADFTFAATVEVIGLLKLTPVLVDVDFGDQMVSTVAKGAIGDSYMQEGDAENAIKYYDIAISNSSNSFTCPLYLKKCAFAHESIQQWNNAITCYERIKNEFPESDEAKSAEKYLVKAQANSTAK